MKAMSQLDVYLSNKSDFDGNILGSVGRTRFPRDQELTKNLANEWQHRIVLSDLLRGESVLLKREQVLLPVESWAKVIRGKAIK